MVRKARSPTTHPPWAALLETPVWITGPEKTLLWLNGGAASLAGAPVSACLGRPCHQVFRGRDEEGRPLCAAECPRWTRARQGKALAPVRLLVGAGEASPRWAQVLLIPVRRSGPEGPWLVHCAVSAEREIRMETYLRRVAARWEGYRPSSGAPSGGALTAREREILGRLAADEELHAIAGGLGISYVTVRNHVQHILTKLGVRSIAEAVARTLLAADGDGFAPSRTPGLKTP
jgi:DNA-binding CsgD family transcriptional regulator